MDDDFLLKLSLSVYKNPGVYALLIGSGVSTAAGIPTGWDVTIDLIRKLMALQPRAEEVDPEVWYREKFGEAPDYAKLLEQIATTPTERMALLRGYFEPSEDERGQGLKVPTVAHRAIAALVKLGYVRMIITTNFDRLVELACEAEGSVPDVISTEDMLKGTLPYVHSSCTVFKLHGDYRDTRLKNTTAELGSYAPEINVLLDRVFDEFGVIVCGWSAVWDTALRNALLRAPNRRFSTFWIARGGVSDEAQRVIQQRRADIITVDSADQIFQRLLENIESLRALEKPHPLSTPLAVATVKRYLSEPRYRIQLFDFVHEEVEQVRARLTSEHFQIQRGITKDIFPGLLKSYEATVERLLAMLAAVAYYGDDGQSVLVVKSVDRLIQPFNQGSTNQLYNHQFYPGLLLTYGTGISALAGRRFVTLSALLRGLRYSDTNRGEKRPAVEKLNAMKTFDGTAAWIPRPSKREFTPGSNYLYEQVRPLLRDYLPSDSEYEATFDIFEYILALTYLEQLSEDRSPIGSFGWRYRYEWGRSPLAEFTRQVEEQGENSELLKAGFFGGSVPRFKELVDKHEQWLNNIVSQWL